MINPSKTNISAQKRLSTPLYRLWLLTSPFFKIPVWGQLDVLCGCYCKNAAMGGGKENHSGTDLHIYFYPSPQHTRLLSFILVDVCVLGSSGWLAVYYSTPGALKVQGLAARKVTAGSPLNSCKLSAGFWRGGGGVQLMVLGGSPARGSFCKYPPPPPVWKEFFSWMLEAVEGNDYIVSLASVKQLACWFFCSC